MTIVVVFEWDDGYVTTVKYPKNIIGISNKGVRPNRMKVLIKNAKAYDNKVAEWFSSCYAALAKV